MSVHPINACFPDLKLFWKIKAGWGKWSGKSTLQSAILSNSGNTLKLCATKPFGGDVEVARGKTAGYGHNARDATMGNPEPSDSCQRARAEGATTSRE